LAYGVSVLVVEKIKNVDVKAAPNKSGADYDTGKPG